MDNSNERVILPENLNGRSIHTSIIPIVCNLKNMLKSFVKVNGDYNRLRKWEKRSYKAYDIKKVSSRILNSQESDWPNIILTSVTCLSIMEFILFLKMVNSILIWIPDRSCFNA